MGDELSPAEEEIFAEYCALVVKIQPALATHYFYDLMPPWDEFKRWRLDQLTHPDNGTATDTSVSRARSDASLLT